MLREPLTNTSPVVIKARSAFGVLAAFGMMAVTARVFWRQWRKEGSSR
jgi:hypothetical protein